MRKLSGIILLMILAVSTGAQVKISGKVKNNKGRPVGGASVSIKDSYDGATTDSLGNYNFLTTEKGSRVITVTSIGFKPEELQIIIGDSSITRLFTLKEEPNELTAVTITAGAFEASDSKRTTVLNPIDIVTTASAQGDVVGAIKTLPGAQQVGESEGLFVRGGTAQETKIFIDGTLVNNYFFSSVPDIAQRGRFSPFIFKGTVFSSGGYSALYGGALSSALILESVDLPDRTSANIAISSVGLGAGYQNLSKDKRSSWGVNYSYTNLTPSFAVIRQRPDNFKIPEFHNGEFNFRTKTSKTGMLKFYGYFNYSNLGLRRPDIDSADLKNAFSLQNFNVYANLSWKEKLGANWKLYLGTSYSTNTDKTDFELQDAGNKPVYSSTVPFDTKTFHNRLRSDLSQVKTVLERKLHGLSVARFGGEYLYFQDHNKFGNRYVTDTSSSVSEHFVAGFAETDIYITNDIAAKIGTRIENSSLLNRSNIVPRVSLAYKVGENAQASLAYGIFYQKPDKDFFIRNYFFNDIRYTRATHYIANYQKITRERTVRIEAFYKKYGNLVKTYASADATIVDSFGNAGYGDAKGFEVFWRDKKTFKNLDYWISYSYLDTKRDFMNYPSAIEPNFAAKHTASLIVKKFITKWKTQFNGAYTFATGRAYYNIRYDNGTSKFRIFEQGRTIPYNSCSFSVNYLPNIGNQSAKKFTVFVLSISNVFGNNQIFGYNYSYNGLRKDPVLPPSKRFIFAGCFISFGVDRSEDVINSNL